MSILRSIRSFVIVGKKRKEAARHRRVWNLRKSIRKGDAPLCTADNIYKVIAGYSVYIAWAINMSAGLVKPLNTLLFSDLALLTTVISGITSGLTLLLIAERQFRLGELKNRILKILLVQNDFLTIALSALLFFTGIFSVLAMLTYGVIPTPHK